MMNPMRVHGYYRYSCPNCKGVNNDMRLIYKAPCQKCLPPQIFVKIKKEVVDKDYPYIVKTYYENVSEPKGLKKLYVFNEKVQEFEEFFKKATGGYRFWSAQRTWAKRVLKGKSFSIIAPTGMGKTMFALTTALYLAKKNIRSHRANRLDRPKCYLVFPTTPLLLQAEKRLKTLANNAGIKLCSDEEDDPKCLKIITFHGKISKKKKEEYMEAIRKGDFDILLSTNMFMHKNYQELMNKQYSFIALDDVDAILRSGKAIKILFYILGVSDEEIQKALEYIRLRQRLAFPLKEDERKELERRLKELERVVEKTRKKIKAIILVSSATGKPRGLYPKLFKVLLGFEAGSKPEAIRNIVDTYKEITGSADEEVASIVRRLGDGGLVYVPIERGIEYAEHLAEILRRNGFKAEAFHAKKAVKLLDQFANGEIDVLVGVATYYGVMVRGIDLPWRVKYAVFVGVPRHKFSTRLENPRPVDIIRVLSILREVLEGEEKQKVEIMIGRISNRLRRLSQAALRMLSEEFQKYLSGETVEETPLLRMLIDALTYARKLLSDPEIQRKLMQLPDIALVTEDDKTYILIPDTATYIQASGRTSRLYPGGITKGLSIILVDDRRLLNGLVKRMRWLFEDFTIKELNEIDLDKLMKEINEERKKVKKILEGAIKEYRALEISKSALLIVESPNKARTIANFFGKPSTRVLDNGMIVYDVTTGDYVLTIVASIGHVYDLVVDEGFKNYGVLKINDYFVPIYTDIKRCNKCGYQFTNEENKCPRCGSRDISRKIDIVDTLRELANEVDIVFIGTDPDTEGEKIGWDLKVLLEPYTNTIKRIEFHEITRKAILNAIRNPRDFDLRLIEAQIVRRIEDRWLGFALSEKLWYDFWPFYCNRFIIPKLLDAIRRGKRVQLINCCETINRNLSAGRVQTPVLGYIIERYEQSRNPRKYGLLKYIGYIEELSLMFELVQEEIEKLGLETPKDLIGRKVVIKDMGEEVVDVNPLPPFTTDTLLEEASRVLGLPATRTMEIAQDLFELGLITYHRTDSIRVSDAGINVARQYLEEKYGDKYKEYFKPRTWGAGGAHEAIRPTRPIDPDRLVQLIKEGAIILAKPLTRQHIAVYRLIFERFIASQMIPAKLKLQRIELILDGISKTLERYVEIVEKGFLEIYNILRIESRVRPGEYIVSDARELKPPLARYHDVIKWMKEKGIGRPSTYAKIIQTLIDRKYVKITSKVKALIPTERGVMVYEFLTKYFGDVVSVDTTRSLEEKMKQIEEGKVDYQEVLAQLYDEVLNKVINRDSGELRREVCPSSGSK